MRCAMRIGRHTLQFVADQPVLSLVVLNWNALDLTRACVESLRATVDVDFQLIVVDNGSEPAVAEWAKTAADLPVLLSENRGFAPGMNAGLAVASGEFVMFVNNDTLFPSGWVAPLLETARHHRGIATPAVTDAGGRFGVREALGTEVIAVPPFRHLPSGVAYLTDRRTIVELGGWDERYRLAGREDLDLLFTYWCNGLSVMLDTRVLVHHASSATVNTMPEREQLWDENWQKFIEKWSDPDASVARLESVDDAAFAARRQEAATVATWMERWYQSEEGRKTARRTIRELKDAPPGRHAGRDPILSGRLGSRIRKTLGAIKRAASPNG